MMNNERRYSLLKIISNDLSQFGKVPLFLLIMVLISSILILRMTYQARMMTIQYKYFIRERASLNIKFINLILTQDHFDDIALIEDIAINFLKMKPIDPVQEKIIQKRNFNSNDYRK